MLKTFNRNKNRSLLCFLAIALALNFLQAQDTKTLPEIEKLYLHTDNSRYFMGENLYYKAYNVAAKNNLLCDNSNILYVELISPDSKIIARHKTSMKIGLGHGDFQLVDSLGVKPGVYQLRAYTNWNRNFGDDFVFKKNIEIIDLFESQSKTNKTQISENESLVAAIVRDKNIRIDFFPEGGSFLENVYSIVGFKAVDSDGKPINVKGEIYDSDNELVASFLSPHDGMGKFQIVPIEGKSYYAKIKTLDGSELQKELPKATKDGYLLSCKAFKGRNIITIATNLATLSQNPNKELTVVCKAKGISYLETAQTLTETALSFELPKDITPEGISQITLYDSNMKPQSERLVYIEKEHDLEVQLSTDKASYLPNEKATINITSKSKEGTPKSASFSLSVTDMNGVADDKEYGTTISSYFLMESDIRGKVSNPGYYFDATNPKRLEHLDDLLLTQGWRNFLWKTMPKAGDNFFYKAEKGISITGRVKQIFGEKPKANSKMSLTLMNKKGMNGFGAITDSVGSFKFENLMFSGKTNMYLNSRNEKGKFRGEIVLDSIEQPPMFVSFKNEPINLPESINSVVENVFKKFTAFGVKPENILDEVVIRDKKRKYAPVFYGVPEYSYMGDKDALKFTNIRDLIDDKLPPLIFLESNIPPEESIYGSPDSSDSSDIQNPTAAGPIVLIDGNPITEAAELTFVSSSDVVKIEAIKGTRAMMYIYGDQAGHGIISIFTNGKNKGNKLRKDIYQSIKLKIDGFYMARAFYSPTPEQAELDNIAAARNTLYWNPEVRPDSTGNVGLSYYNTKIETKVKVALEGITATGIPVVKNVYYDIKK